MINVEIPSTDLFDKLGDCPIVLWVLVGGKDYTYNGIFTETEKAEYEKTDEYKNSEDYWNRVEFTMKELFRVQEKSIRGTE